MFRGMDTRSHVEFGLANILCDGKFVEGLLNAV